MKALTIWQPWASLCVLPRNPAYVEQHRVEGGSLSCRHCNQTFTFNFMRDTGPHVCTCRQAKAALAEAVRPIKTIETRGWRAPKSLIGQRIAIHAAATKRPLYDLLKAEALGELVDPGESDPFGVRPARLILDVFRAAEIEPVDLPLGAVIGTAVLAACVPMIADPDPFCSGPQDPAHLRLNAQRTRMTYWRPGDRHGVDLTDQLPFGWYEPGRYGWMLTDVERFPGPIWATGRQGVWEWQP